MTILIPLVSRVKSDPVTVLRLNGQPIDAMRLPSPPPPMSPPLPSLFRTLIGGADSKRRQPVQHGGKELPRAAGTSRSVRRGAQS